MCDAFLVLAQADGGLSCFLVPRVLPDGTRNGFHIQRLKDKLGDRSNASSEIELDAAWARLVGEEGRGVPTIIEMVNHTRLDCVLGTAAAMRVAVEQATHHAAHRSAFGKLLVDQPLMQQRARRPLRRVGGGDADGAAARARLRRAARTPSRESPRRSRSTGSASAGRATRPRRSSASAGTATSRSRSCRASTAQQPLQSIWEGSGNVICLDVLRALRRNPETRRRVRGRVPRGCRRRPRGSTRGSARSNGSCAIPTTPRPARAGSSSGWRLALQASLLVRHGDAAVADAFCASRLGGDGGLAYGTLPPRVDTAAIVERHRPRVSS